MIVQEKAVQHAGAKPLQHTLIERTDDGPRIRHVKCDQLKPACGRCTSTGRTCDGYVGVPTAEATSMSLAKRSQHPLLAVTAYSIPFQVPGSQEDRLLIHYFCVKG